MKYMCDALLLTYYMSPSTRREWIEIAEYLFPVLRFESPSTRREWIEMGRWRAVLRHAQSPSTRREWIEIYEIPRHISGS